MMRREEEAHHGAFVVVAAIGGSSHSVDVGKGRMVVLSIKGGGGAPLLLLAHTRCSCSVVGVIVLLQS